MNAGRDTPLWRFCKRLIVAVVFIPTLMAWLFLAWVQWLITGRYPDWPGAIIEWSKR